MDPYVACLHRLDLAWEEKGWEQSPCLYELYQHTPGGRVTPVEVPVPESVWYAAAGERHGPGAVLLEYAGRYGPATPRPNQVGWLFACEGWGVFATGYQQAQINRLRKKLRSRMIDTDPDRIELRMFNGCSYDRRHFALRHAREYPDVDVSGWDGTGKALAAGFGGSIFAALRRLCGHEDARRSATADDQLDGTVVRRSAGGVWRQNVIPPWMVAPAAFAAPPPADVALPPPPRRWT